MNPLFANCEKVTKAIEVSIPTMEGDAVADSDECHYGMPVTSPTEVEEPRT